MVVGWHLHGAYRLRISRGIEDREELTARSRLPNAERVDRSWPMPILRETPLRDNFMLPSMSEANNAPR